MKRKIIGITVGSPISPESMSEKIGFDPETNATKKWVQDSYQPKGNYLTEVPNGYATEEYVRNRIAEAELGGEEVDLSGYLQKSELPDAVNDALIQAKESGEFDGKDGQDGYTPQKNVDYFDGKNGSDGKDGTSPVVSVSAITGGHRITITDVNGTKNVDVMDGSDGTIGKDGNGIKSAVLNADYTLTLTFDDGTSYTTPSIRGATGGAGKDGKDGQNGTSATHSWNGTTLTITSASGTSSADLKGAKGDKGDKGDSIKGDTGSPGADGVSPTVSVSKSGKVTTVSITDKNGTKTATINDGADGSNGKDGTNGVSATHSWSGTTLTVTSASGTSSANLKGDKGDSVKGDTGSRGFSVLRITTAPSGYTTATGGFTPTYRVALSTVLSQSKSADVVVGDTVVYSYYTYPVGYVDSTYVYLGARVSIRGATGAAYTLTDADKSTIVDAVIAALPDATEVSY